MSGLSGLSGLSGMPAIFGGVEYLLHDEFTTARLAGAVNGTAAEPGPGTRTVVDVESKLSITSGKLTLASQVVTPAYNEEYLVYTDVALARVAGRVLMADWSISTDAASFPLAVVSSTTPTWIGFVHVRHALYRSSATVLVVAANQALGPNVIAFATSTAYSLALVLKATGSYYFIKGGAFTNWTLIWIGITDNTATLYAGIDNLTAVFTTDNLRVPVAIWLPTPLAYDTFTRANGALGNSEATGPDAQAVTARAWTGATWTIATNAAVNTPTAGGDVVVNGGFATDTAWSKDAGWSIAGGIATKASGAAADISQNATVAGTWYTTSVNVLTWTAGSLQQIIGGSFAPASASTGVRIATARATSNTVGCRAGGTLPAGTIDDVICNPLTLSTLFASLTDAATADVKVRVQVGALTSGTQCGLVARLDNATTPQNFIIMYFDGSGSVKVEEMVAGTYAATVLSVVKAFTASDWLELDLSGTAYRTYHITNAGVATLLGSGTVQTTTGTLHGLFSTYASNTVLGTEVWPKGTGNEYSRLGAF